MTAAAHLEAEAAARRWAAPATALAGILPLAAAVAGVLIVRDAPKNRPGGVLFLHDKAAVLNVAAVVHALGALALAAALVYLFDAIKVRRPELPDAFKWVAVGGAVAYALCGTLTQTVPPFGLLFQVLAWIRAGDFATSGGQTWQEAHDLFSTGAFTVISIVQLLGTFALAASIALLALNALRVGLMTRAFGYIGVFAAVLVIVPLGPSLPVVQAFWLVALAALVAGLWPGGRPPAWESGRAEPWPSLQRMREQQAQAPGEREAAPEPRPDPRPPRPGHPGAARRKRKRQS